MEWIEFVLRLVPTVTDVALRVLDRHKRRRTTSE
jgi:hypothetical protein